MIPQQINTASPRCSSSIVTKDTDVLCRRGILLELLDGNSRDPNVLQTLGDCFYKNRMVDSSTDRFARRAVKYYKRGATLKSPMCTLNVGNCYYHGIGVKQDKECAMEYYHRASKLNNAMAQRALAVCYGERKQSDLEMHFYRLAANHGDCATQKALADLHYTQHRFTQAVKWYKRVIGSHSSSQNGTHVSRDSSHAHAMRLSDAQNALGVCYASGKGIGRSFETAHRLFYAAAKQGHAQGQYNMGVMCRESGHTKESEKWFALAAAQGIRQRKAASQKASSKLSMMSCSVK